MSGWMQDLRYALRQLRRSPGFTAVAVLSLALGIGGTAAIFSAMEEVLLRPLPVPAADGLVNLSAPGPKPGWTSCNMAGGCEEVFSYPMFRDLQEGTGDLFTGIGAHFAFWPNVGLRDGAVPAKGLYVSGSYFPTLEIQPALGRLLRPEDDRVIGGHPVAVLGHRFWENRLGGDPEVVGSTIRVNGEAFQVVGVTPPGFEGTTREHRTDIYVPLTMRGVLAPSYDGFEHRTTYSLYLFARLAPGVSPDRALDDLNRVYRPILQEVEAPLQDGMTDGEMERFLARGVGVSPGARGQSNLHRDAPVYILLLLAITGTVLLIACANVANLLLARGTVRRRELVIRSSLGAGRGKLLRQLLTESVVLALAGGLAGLLVARWTSAAIRAFLPEEMGAVLELGLSPVVLGFTAVVALGAGVAAGLYPALHLTRDSSASLLKGSSSVSRGGRGEGVVRTTLATAQIALAMALLISAGLFTRSLMNLGQAEVGLETEGLVSFSVYPAQSGYSPEGTEALLLRMQEALEALPDVEAASAGVVAVLRQNSWGANISLEGIESGPGTDTNVRTNWVAPGYFQTMGTPLLAGREFTGSDDASSAPVAVVNQAFARKFGLDPQEMVGRRMAIGGGNPELGIQIVGLVGDASYATVKDPPPPLFVIPWQQSESVNGLPVTGLTFYARAGSDPAAVQRAIPDLVRSVAPDVPVEDLGSVVEHSRETLFADRMMGSLASAFAGLATLLAAMGLFGVLAFSVAQRTREIGLRIAVGASSRDVEWMVIRQVAWMTLIGGAVGVAAALGVGQAAQSLLFEVQGHDPWAILAGVVLVATVALAAGLVPARRAARVDPMEALRDG